MICEILGVNLGIIFGDYEYGGALGYNVFDVPLLIGANWAILTVSCSALSATLFDSVINKIIMGVFLMVMLDAVIEPIAPILDFWEFDGGIAPIKNYIGWFITSFVIQLIYQKMKINFSPLFSVLIYLTQMGFFILLLFLI